MKKRGKKLILFLIIFIFLSYISIYASETEPKVITSKNLRDNSLSSKGIIVDSIEGNIINGKFIDEEGNITYFSLNDFGLIDNYTDSFIVEFEEPSIIEKTSELEKTADDNERKIKSMNNLNPLKYSYMLFSLRKSDVPNEISDYKKAIKTEREKIKESIKNKLGKKEIKSITGNAVLNQEDLNIKDEYKNVFNGISIKISPEEAEELKEVNGVKNIIKDKIVYANLMDSVPLIGASNAWLIDADGNLCSQSGKDCLTGKGITIAIIDTGIDYTHPDLGNCTQSKFLAGNCEKVIGGYDFVNNDNNPMDDHGHGTHCAGITSGSGQGGLKGVAPDSKLYAYKVLSSGGSGTWSQVMSGIERAVDPNNDGNTSDHVDVISMSLGGSGNPDDAVSIASDNAVNAGVVVVIAAGNSGPSSGTIGSPGTSRNAITVGATYKKDYIGKYWNDVDPKTNQITSFSSRGPVTWSGGTLNKPDIVAPGALICSARWDSVDFSSRNPLYSLCLDNKHVNLAGTSMATPIVAGASALIKQKHPNWSPGEIKSLIKNSADNLGYDINTQGAGLINLNKALNNNIKPLTAIISTSGELSGNIIPIIGSAKGDNFTGYSLYYRNAIGGSNIEICSSNNQVSNDVLCNFNIGDLLNKDIILELNVRSIFTNSSYTSNIKIVNTKIAYPINLYDISDAFNREPIPTWKDIDIIGNSYSNNFKNYELKLCDSKNNCYPDAITITNNGNSVINNGTLGKIIGSKIINPDYYNIILTTYKNNGESSTYTSRVYLDPSLHKNSPFTKYSTPYWYKNQPNIADINKDGKNEIISSGSYSPFITDIYTKVFDDEFNNIVGFPETNISGSIASSIADIDNDGYNEIVIIANYFIAIRNHDGSYLLRPKRLTNSITLNSPPVISDINNDGYLEIIIVEYLAYGSLSLPKIYVIDKNGNSLSGWPKELDSIPGNYYSGIFTPAVGDVNNDGYKEIFAIEYSYNTSLSLYTRIIGYNYLGQKLLGWPKDFIGVDVIGSDSLSLADVNNDKKLEIITTTSGDLNNPGKLHVFNYDGSYFSGFPISPGYLCKSYSGSSYICGYFSGPTVGDIDNDKQLEIFFQAGQNNKALVMGLRCILGYKVNGTILKGFPICIKSGFANTGCSGVISIANLDSDPEQEIICTPNMAYTSSGDMFGLYAYNKDGSIVQGFPKRTNEIGGVDMIPVGDIDNDNKNEFIFGAGNNPTFIYDTTGNSGYDEWPLIAHDKEFTGLYTPASNYNILYFSNPLNLTNIVKEIAIDSSENNLYFVWNENNDIFYSLIKNNGELKEYKKPVSSGVYNSENPSIINTEGNSYIVFDDDRDGNKEIYFSKLVNNSFIEKRLTYDSASSTKPKILSSYPDLVVLFLDNRENIQKIFYKKIDKNGNDIIIDKPISSEAINFDAIISTNNTVYLTWQDNQNKIYISSINNGNIINSKQILAGKNPRLIKVDSNNLGLSYNDIQNNLKYSIVGINDFGISNDIVISQNGENPYLINYNNQAYLFFQEKENNIYQIFYSTINNGKISLNKTKITNTNYNSINPFVASINNSVVLLYNEISNKNILKFLTTAILEKNIPKLISNKISDIETYSAKLIFTSDEPTIAELKLYKNGTVSNNYSDKNLSYEHTFLVQGLDPGTKYYNEITLKDIVGNVALYNVNYNNLNNSNFRTRATSKIPELPTNTYGRVETTDGNKVPDIEVSAKWIDVDNNTYYTKTKTLNENEASAIGDKSLVGYFMCDILRPLKVFC